MAETEKRAREALGELTEREGLSLGEAVEWCRETITVREATRLRRLANEPQTGDDGDKGVDHRGDQGVDRAALATADGEGVGVGSWAG